MRASSGGRSNARRRSVRFAGGSAARRADAASRASTPRIWVTYVIRQSAGQRFLPRFFARAFFAGLTGFLDAFGVLANFFGTAFRAAFLGGAFLAAAFLAAAFLAGAFLAAVFLAGAFLAAAFFAGAFLAATFLAAAFFAGAFLAATFFTATFLAPTFFAAAFFAPTFF